jgi:GAF domain-containing protein
MKAMKSYLSHTVLRIVQRMVDAPEQTLSRVAERFGTELQLEASGTSAPDHVMVRLESVFDALSELPFQCDVGAAFDLACDTLQAELPAEAIAAGVYDINADEVRIVAARGLEHELGRGSIIPRGRCFAGRTNEEPFLIGGGPGGVDWLGSGDASAEVMLCPIVRDDHLLGVLALATPLCANRFEEHDLELVSYVADQLATFIQAQRRRPSIPAPGTARRA